MKIKVKLTAPDEVQAEVRIEATIGELRRLEAAMKEKPYNGRLDELRQRFTLAIQRADMAYGVGEGDDV